MVTLLEKLKRERKARLTRFAIAASNRPGPKTTNQGVYLYVSPIGPAEYDPNQYFRLAHAMIDEDVGAKYHTIAEVIDAVLEEYGIGKLEFVSVSRSRRIVVARQVAFYVCRMMTKGSLNQIAAQCGHKDHSTVHHGAKQVADNMHTFGPVVRSVMARLNATRELSEAA